jgi:hypothetical protein
MGVAGQRRDFLRVPDALAGLDLDVVRVELHGLKKVTYFEFC